MRLARVEGGRKEKLGIEGEEVINNLGAMHTHTRLKVYICCGTHTTAHSRSHVTVRWGTNDYLLVTDLCKGWVGGGTVEVIYSFELFVGTSYNPYPWRRMNTQTLITFLR